MPSRSAARSRKPDRDLDLRGDAGLTGIGTCAELQPAVAAEQPVQYQARHRDDAHHGEVPYRHRSSGMFSEFIP